MGNTKRNAVKAICWLFIGKALVCSETVFAVYRVVGSNCGLLVRAVVILVPYVETPAASQELLQ